MMNRIDQKFKTQDKILSIYFSAGFPNIDDTRIIIKELESSGVDMIEIGLPFSDPLADGPTIQKSSTVALNNGMNTSLLFEQLKDLRKITDVPVVIMGYFNPILQFGIKKFCKSCKEVGVDGLIIPDLPVDIYNDKYQKTFKSYGLLNMFLITPQTSHRRIKYIDKISKGFIYMVSSYNVTGAIDSFDSFQKKYFKRINSMKLKSPLLVGFGISNKDTFIDAGKYSRGAIIGSAYINWISENGIYKTLEFIKSLKD
mgnify:FL=1